METYEINTAYFQHCLQAVSKEESRYYISGVYIHDENGIRHYVGTNGHVLVHCFEPTEDKPIEKGLIIKPLSALKKNKTLSTSLLRIIDDRSAIIDSFNASVCCEIIDGQYPNYNAVIPTNAEQQTKYVCFDHDYLKIVRSVLGKFPWPCAEDTVSTHLFRDECFGKENSGVEVVLMPIRI